MFRVSLVLATMLALSACTSTEKNVGGGAAAGAIIGGIAGGTEGALIGGALGAGAGYLVRQLEGGNCQYRDNNGRIYTAPCR